MTNKVKFWIVGIIIATLIILLMASSAGCTSYKTHRVEIIGKTPPETLIVDMDGERHEFPVPRWYYESHPVGWVEYYNLRSVDLTNSCR